MAKSAVVIGGAGTVGSGVVKSLRDAGWEVCVVDPAGGDVAAVGTVDLLDRVGPCDLAVVSLPARGQGRAEGEFRAAEAASSELPTRLAALELAFAALQAGTLIELCGGAALDPASDEAGLIGRWQRGVRSGLDGAAGIRAILCAITCYVPVEDAAGFGSRIRELTESDHPGGICRIDAADRSAEWVD